MKSGAEIDILNCKKLLNIQNQNQIFIAHNVAKFRGSLTPMQSKGILVLLKHTKNLFQDNKVNDKTTKFNITFDEFESLYGIKSTKSKLSRISELDKTMTKILGTIFEFGKKDDIEKSVFIQYFKIKDDSITYMFGEYIRQFLNPISSALIIDDFPLLMSFKSEYSRQLYKHLMAWRNTGLLELSVSDVRDYLGIPNTSTYEKINNIKLKVLDVAVNEINEKTGLDIKYFTNRELDGSKKIEKFYFRFKSIKQLS